MTIADDIKESFRKGSTLTRLIYFNLAAFVLIKACYVIFFLFNKGEWFELFVTGAFAVPAALPQLAAKPWTILTYMFLHLDFLHILFNILWLYWFGKVFLAHLTGRQMLSVYFLGGLSGAVLYILAFNLFPVFNSILQKSAALGASAAVMAVAVAIAVYLPDYIFYLVFIGPVKIKYIILFFFITDILMIGNGNAGGHLAHIGGAVFGYWFAIQYRKGNDITRWFNRIMEQPATWFKSKPRIKVTYGSSRFDDYEYNKRKADEQEEIDRILDKIAKSGYNNLTLKEKEKLFNAGHK